MKTIKVIFTSSGCVLCEDFRNRKLYEQNNLKEYSLDDAEGLSLACYFAMWKSDKIITPCSHVGQDIPDDRQALKFWGAEVEKYLRFSKRRKN